MKGATLCLVLCFVAMALRTRAQDRVVFLPPADFDKDAPTPGEKPTEPVDEDKKLPQDNGKREPTSAPPPEVDDKPIDRPNLGGSGDATETDAAGPTGPAEPTDPHQSDVIRPIETNLQGSGETTAADKEGITPRPNLAAAPQNRPTNAPAVPAENCTGVKCSLEVLSNCKHPVLLPGRCCPSCPNKSVCSDVCCGRGKICSEYEDEAICCDKHSYYSYSRKRQFHASLNAVNKFGEECSLRHAHHDYVRVCNRSNCMRDETCYPVSANAASCCARRWGTKPICIVNHLKVLGRCTLAPPIAEERSCTCRVVRVVGYGYRGYGRRRYKRDHGHHYGGHRGRVNHHGDYHGNRNCGDSIFMTYKYSPDKRRVYWVRCNGPEDVCRAKLRGGQRSRRSAGSWGGLIGSVLRHFGYRRMCRTVRV